MNTIKNTKNYLIVAFMVILVKSVNALGSDLRCCHESNGGQVSMRKENHNGHPLQPLFSQLCFAFVDQSVRFL